jgi:cytoskeleton protein RodZ
LFEFMYSSTPASVDTVPAPQPDAVQPGMTTNPQDFPPAAPVQLPAAEPSASAATEPAAEPVATVSVPAKRAGTAEVQMVFERQSWVEVRDRDDRIVFSQLNPAGAVHHVQGQAPLNVVIGNASGVRVTYNGKLVDLAPHTRVEVARLTLD